MKKTFIFLLSIIAVQTVIAKVYNVTDVSGFNTAVSGAQAGDTIYLSEGRWENVKLVFQARGEKGNPVLLKARTPGKTVICGRSTLQLSGQYLRVEGLFFTEGEPVKKNAVEFKNDKGEPASYSTISNCVMLNYNNKDPKSRRQWIDLYGVENSIEYCYFEGKTDLGVVVSIEIDSLHPQPNHHRIHHNYFAHRPRYIESNGGEIIRIARGETERFSSQTAVEDNYFERCDGENEIVSVKSCDNIIRRNVFLECEGGVSLRCGSGTEVYENCFLGNGKPLTCGVKVHFKGHKIHNNLFYKLMGTGEFSAGVALVYGNRSPRQIFQHDPVSDVQIVNNTFVDCALPLNLGAPNEAKGRIIPPEKVLIANNIVCFPQKAWYTGGENNNGIQITDNRIYKDSACRCPVHEEKLTDVSGKLPNPSNCGPAWYRK